MRKSALRRLAQLGEMFKPSMGLSPEQRESLDRLVAACIEAGGGQRPDESKADAMARGLGLPSGAELKQLLEERMRCGRACAAGWPD